MTPMERYGLERVKVNDVMYACSVHICIKVLVNYDFTTHYNYNDYRKFLSKHCIKRVLDTDMNWLSLFQFYRVDPKQPKMSNFHFDLFYHWNFPKGMCTTFQGRCKNYQGRCKTISGEVAPPPHLPSKSGHVNYTYLYVFILFKYWQLML